MVLMRVRNDDCVEFLSIDHAEVRQSVVAFLLRVHAAVEDEALAAALEVITVCADLGAARQISEFQSGRAP